MYHRVEPRARDASHGLGRDGGADGAAHARRHLRDGGELRSELGAALRGDRAVDGLLGVDHARVGERGVRLRRVESRALQRLVRGVDERRAPAAGGAGEDVGGDVELDEVRHRRLAAVVAEDAALERVVRVLI